MIKRKIKISLMYGLLVSVLLGVGTPQGMIICKHRALQTCHSSMTCHKAPKVCHSEKGIKLAQNDGCMITVEKQPLNVTLRNDHLSQQKDFTFFQTVHFPNVSDAVVETVLLASANHYFDTIHLYLLNRQLIL